ncbi:hypothetical protein H2248_004053 [Termitomyces sp. 'cryptogamus']|nr:hypothetical protein H2248_004053 [Termitomyces sp. 'cryptogamus']
MKALGKDSRDVETIEVLRLVPEWKCSVEVTIDGTAEKAIEKEWKNNTNIRIYTDESGYKEKIGVVAVLYWGIKVTKVVRKCLGREEDHTVAEEGTEEQEGGKDGEDGHDRDR